jgi:hypothetical protein
MIKFFRKIRQKLLPENKFSKYLIYAIGEIILVVIGILIALQINNWNEKRILTDKEVRLLNEMLNELKTDSSQFTSKLKSANSKLNATELLIGVIDDKKPYHDSLNISFSKAVVWTVFSPSNSTYQTLTNTGISIISNETLRSSIQHLYNNTYKFISEVEKWRSDFYFAEMSSFNIESFKIFSWYKPSIPLNGQDLLNDTKYYNILETQQTLANQEVAVYKNTKKEIDALMNLIEKEITK